MATLAAERNKPARNDELIKVAARLFRDRGFDATSMQQIADEMGILKGSLYHYVATKDDLLWMIVEPPLRALVDDAEAIFHNDSLTATEKIEAAVIGHCHSFEEHYPHMFVMTLEHGNSLSPARRKDFDALRHRYFTLWREAIKAGMDAGELSSGLDPATAAHAILGMINWMPRWFGPRGRLKAEEIGRHFASLAIDGVKPR